MSTEAARQPAKILFVTPRPPWPPDEGDQLIAWQQLQRLGAPGSGFSITLLCLDSEGADEARLQAALAPFCARVHLVPGGKDMRRVLRSLWNGLPMMVNLFHDAAVARRIDDLARREAPQLVHVQTIHMAEYFRAWRGPKVLDMVDALSLNLARRAPLEPWPRRLAYRREARALRRYEDGVLPAYTRALLVSAEDAAHYPRVALAVNPNGTAVTPERVAAAAVPAREKLLVFHGTMRYFANVDAAGFFAREVFPALRARHPDLRLALVGRHPRPAVQALAAEPGVTVTGAVDDVVPWLCRAAVGVYPLRTGTGMKNKLVEALACALPSVVSPRALEGLPGVRAPEHVLLASTTREWVDAVDGLLREPARAARLGAAGQAAVAGRFSWDDNAARLGAVWREALAGDTPGP